MEKAEFIQSLTLAEPKNNVDSSDPQITEEVIIEELSIDGICGVY